jgi:RecB family exonuclease
MTVYEVRSINRHRVVEIAYRYTPAWAEFEMDCRRLSDHSAIQSRAVEVQPRPDTCEKQPKPGRVREGGGR